ncbi:MAG: rcc [Paenibacillus sp.]|nr:rcc [Paenibacillus sp.]
MLVLGMTVGMLGLTLPVGNSVEAGQAAIDPQISAGFQHSEWLKSDGTVWAWGYGTFGQLGDGKTTYNQKSPVRTVGLDNITAVAAGFSHTLWLKSDGTVWASGYNQFGQVGNNSTDPTNKQAEPVQLAGLSGVTAVAAGQNHSVALKDDGTVWVWGGNNSFQLGDGTSTNSPVPKQVPGLSDVVEISAGSNNVIVRKNDGTYWAWGDGNSGQLGDGTINIPSTPVQLTAVNNIKAIASGDKHMLWLKTDGTVWASGNNDYGNLGDDSTIQRKTPVQVTGLTDVKAIAAAGFSMALKNDGTVWTWGRNEKGQLGDGTTTERHTPVQVAGLSDVVAIRAGGDRDFGHALVLKSDGTVWAWGYNSNGQVGDGNSTNLSTPVQVTDLIPPAYQSAAVSNGYKTVTLTFDQKAASLKAAVTLAKDGTTFNALTTDDTVTLSGSTLVVKLKNALEGTLNKIQVAADTLEDQFGNALATAATTEALEGEVKTYTIATIGDQTFSSLVKGYASGSPQTKTITVTRTGTGDLTNLGAAISGTDASAFVLTQPGVTTLNAGSPSTSFTVKAKDSLEKGTYTATVTVSADKLSDVTFTVTQKVAALKGDYNGDGMVTPTDVLAVTKYMNQLITLTPEQFEALDMNDDGYVNAADATLIMQAYLGGAQG